MASRLSAGEAYASFFLSPKLLRLAYEHGPLVGAARVEVR